MRRMELVHFIPRAFWSLFLLSFFLSCINYVGIGFPAPASGNQTDRLTLIAFKDRISDDPSGVFNSWNDSVHFCKWVGVICSRRHPQRVTALNLDSRRLVGPISPHIANLTFLRRIDLRRNSFHGEIPREISSLFRLRFLVLSENQLQGEIPHNLSHCSEIRFISLYLNNLEGNIPVELQALSKLQWLSVSGNYLTGNIPTSFGNLSSLVSLFLYENSLEGRIPNELGQLVKLETLAISANKLSGMIPPSIYNLSCMVGFSVSANRLEGNLPANLGLAFPNLKQFFLGGNAFTGPIPASLPNASGLTEVGFTYNNFSGPVPPNLGNLHDLRILHLAENKLGGGEGDDELSFLTSLTNCSRLEVLDVSSNLLRGVLPATIANLSTNLTKLGLGRNPISGIIPTDIGNLFNLTGLGIFESSIMGTIPIGIGKLQNLVELHLYSNKLSGQIPSSIGNITGLSILSLYGNRLHGSIPSSLGNCSRLQTLYLHRNELNGTIPKEVLSISSLGSLFVEGNSLVESLPSEVGNLKQLRDLYVAHNKLMGEIPSTLGNCLSLEVLNLSNNFFQGAIPSDLKKLQSIKLLDLSHNNLSGHIPIDLEKFPILEYLDLSSNDLNGEVPHEGIFKNASAFSVLGNKKLCGGIPELQLPTCPKKASKKHGRSISLTVTFSVIGGVLCLILLSFFFVTLYRKASKKHLPASFLDGQFLNVSYADLLKAIGEFSSENLIGEGSYGSVYKGILDRDETIVAVKVLRHRNLVKIITACSSKGDDFKALVFEYMPNGNLEQWLHQTVYEQLELRSLSLIQRLDIAIDVASALEYLHHHCGTPVVHHDLKPSNVLLDDDMCAHVGDFGLARFLSDAASNTSQDQTSSTGIKGSVGYIPPGWI